MIRSIIDGMTAAIRSEYDETFTVYTESTEQDLKKPCFSILCLKSTNEQKVGTRRDRTYSCVVSYYPESTEPMKECLNVMENLYELLEIIDVDSKKIRGKDMKCEFEEGILKFEITYTVSMAVTVVETTMEALEVKTDGN